MYAQWNLFIKDTLNKGHCLKSQPHRAVYKSTCEYRDTTLYRTASWLPVVSSIERYHCTSAAIPIGLKVHPAPLPAPPLPLHTTHVSFNEGIRI